MSQIRVPYRTLPFGSHHEWYIFRYSPSSFKTQLSSAFHRC